MAAVIEDLWVKEIELEDYLKRVNLTTWLVLLKVPMRKMEWVWEIELALMTKS